MESRAIDKSSDLDDLAMKGALKPEDVDEAPLSSVQMRVSARSSFCKVVAGKSACGLGGLPLRVWPRAGRTAYGGVYGALSAELRTFQFLQNFKSPQLTTQLYDHVSEQCHTSAKLQR